MKDTWKLLAAASAVVIGVYAYTAHSGFLASTSLNAADTYYNLLVQGFRSGQLSLKKDVPPGFAQLADPYDRTANCPYEVLDLSYYKGKFYLYFGVTPAVVLFWPYVALTGHYLSQKNAAVIFCVIGFLASVGLLRALWRRYFAEVSVAVVAAGTLALGLATFTPLLLARCDVWEVPISCGYAFTWLALAAVWKTLHEQHQQSWWLAAGSLAYGLAVAARPSLLFGAVILLVPVACAWRGHRQPWALLMAAIIPIAVIGLGLVLYNTLRFDNPFEFGWRYALAGDKSGAVRPFSLRYLWFHIRVYFLEPAGWSGRFPFVRDITVPPLPARHGRVEHPFGVLTNVPLVWLALAVPLAWRGRSAATRSTLRGFLAAVAALFVTSTLTLGLFFSASIRYEVEFLPALVLLAVIGVLSLERALAPTSESGPAGRPVWRRAVRWGWGVLLGFSVAFNLLVSAEYCAEAHYNLGCVLSQQGRVADAVAHYEWALRLNPDFAEVHYNLGSVLARTGRTPEAMAHFEQALRIKPDYAEAHYNLGTVLVQAGRVQDGIGHYERALRLRPDYAEAHYNLGLALVQSGKVPEAIGHWEQALRLKPDFADAHNNLGLALWLTGKEQEAIGQFDQALHLKPDYAEAHNNLGLALLQLGRSQEAIGHFEQALQIKPDYAEAHYALGTALEQAGRVQEAIGHYEEALQIKPDFAQAQNALARLHAGQ